MNIKFSFKSCITRFVNVFCKYGAEVKWGMGRNMKASEIETERNVTKSVFSLVRKLKSYHLSRFQFCLRNPLLTFNHFEISSQPILLFVLRVKCEWSQLHASFEKRFQFTLKRKWKKKRDANLWKAYQNVTISTFKRINEEHLEMSSRFCIALSFELLQWILIRCVEEN